MATLNIPLDQVQLFLFVFLRVGIILIMLPILDSRNVPPIMKVGLALAVSLVLFPVLELEGVPLITGVFPFVLGVAAEAALGFAIGLSVRLLFTGIQMAGQLAGFQMGFSVANVMDPQSHAQISIIAQLNYLIGVMILLAINAHHWFIWAVAESFRLIPPMGFHVSAQLTHQIMAMAAGMFTVAIKIGAPVIVALLLTSVALGVVARTVPQMNIFIVAFPLKIVVGLVFFMLTLPHLSGFLQEIFGNIGNDVLLILRAGR